MSILTTAEAAAHLRISPWTLRRMAGSGEIRGSFYGGAWHFDQADIQAFRDQTANRAPIRTPRRNRRAS